jgi:hypothetical protein
MADSQDPLQISIHELQTVTYKYGLKISTMKTKTMAFKGTDPVGNETVINNNNIIEQINTFSHPV